MMFKTFSPRQKLAITWWKEPSTAGYDAIICDGAVRSGKTLSMSLGFVLWAMSSYKDQSFALCGKTITSVKRNVVTPLKTALDGMGFTCEEKLSKNYMDIKSSKGTNRFHFFGGKDESSASLIQGMTLGGVLLDEVALMPRSFVEQALARCSLTGSRLWFNCNPESPYHWFYREWILKARQKNALYLHFTMRDNPSLSQRVQKRYRALYSGVFYDRFVLGRWITATGLVYPMFDKNTHVFREKPVCDRFLVSCDYGTVNPSSFGLWGHSEGKWYRLAEYYYASKTAGQLRTDEEHYAGLEALIGEKPVECVLVDPSAASFMECIRRHGKYPVVAAKNDVLSGIRRVCDALKQGRILFHESCADSIREFSLYVWDEQGSDAPVKENDHAMDEIRYFVSHISAETDGGFFVGSLSRGPSSTLIGRR